MSRTMKRYSVSHDTKGVVQVDGYEVGRRGWALTRALYTPPTEKMRGNWTLTHCPSGFAVVHLKGKGREMAGKIAKVFGEAMVETDHTFKEAWGDKPPRIGDSQWRDVRPGWWEGLKAMWTEAKVRWREEVGKCE